MKKGENNYEKENNCFTVLIRAVSAERLLFIREQSPDSCRSCESFHIEWTAYRSCSAALSIFQFKQCIIFENRWQRDRDIQIQYQRSETA